MEETELNTNFIQQLATECTYRLHSLVQLLQQLATGYRPGTGYTALYTYFNNWLQSVPTDYWLNSLVLVTVCSQPYTVASTGYSVPATQPCTLASTTGYRVYRLVLATQPCTLASATGYRVYRLVLATQPCTLASFYGLQVY